MKKIISLQLVLIISIYSFSQKSTLEPYLSIPIIDLDKETSRQVVVDREDGQYLGHPTTALLEDGKTILIVYPKGHGRGEIVYKRSSDGGLIWSPTEGDWIGWVGRWKDLMKGKPGQYRIRFKDNIHSWDCAYPGVELLPDGTFVVTTYGHWEKDKEPYIVSIRFKMEELDKKFREN